MKNFAQNDSQLIQTQVLKERSKLDVSEPKTRDFKNYRIDKISLEPGRLLIEDQNAKLVTENPQIVKIKAIGKKLTSKVVQSSIDQIVGDSRKGIPSCPEPTSLTSVDVSRTTAELGWKSNAGGDAWEVEVIEDGLTPTGSGTIVTVNPYTVTNLMPATTYDFYVRELCYDPPTEGELIITGILDGPLPQALPKFIEFEAIGDIDDLSIYGIALATNGSGSSGSPSYTFPAIEVLNGEVIYLTRDLVSFSDYMGFDADFENISVTGFNGNDAVELYNGSTVVDVFGDPNVDGEDEAWDYEDGWATRKDFESSNGGTFVSSNWSFSGANALDGESNNATSATPFPSGSFDPAPSSTSLWTGPASFTTLTGSIDSCFAGTIAFTELQLVCPNELAVARTNGDEEFRSTGGYGWRFIEGEGAAGGLAGGFDISDISPNFSFDNTLNGFLNNFDLDPLEGNWKVRGFSY